MEHRIAVDAGQSSTRVRAHADGVVTEASYPGVLTDRPLAPQWARVIGAFGQQHPEIRPDAVAVGSSGLGSETAENLLRLVGTLGIHRVSVAHDSVSSYLGALGDEHGAIIAAGTGTICLAWGPGGIARVDGWGSLLGDAGSAYWIGRSALEAALRGYDGRRQLTRLTEVMRTDFPDLEQAYLEIQSDPDRVARIASYAKKVDELASVDRVANLILDKAAAHLAEAVQAGIRRAGLAGRSQPHVVALGGVFESTMVRNRFVDFLTLQWPNFALVEPAGDTVAGTMALLDLSPDHPFDQFVTHAGH